MGAMPKTVMDGGNICKRFNRGHCTFGPSCRFEHRCKYCKKFGHGIHVCRKLKQDKANQAKQDIGTGFVAQEMVKVDGSQDK